MSKADVIFINNMKDIMENGFNDKDLPVRPHWEDGTPAHTIKKFGIVNVYDLQEELPILTIRRTAFKSCLDELLWIWQKKSNNIHDLNSHIWDSWADETGSIGKAYGYQLAKKSIYPLWGFWDNRHWVKNGGMIASDGREKPAAKRVYDLWHKVWTTDLYATAGENGEAKFRGFKGYYQVNAGDKKFQITVK